MVDTLLPREFLRNPLRDRGSDVQLRRDGPPAQRGGTRKRRAGGGRAWRRTGACTGVIQHRLNGRGRHIAVEINSTFAKLLTERYPRVEVVCGEALLETLLESLDRNGLHPRCPHGDAR